MLWRQILCCEVLRKRLYRGERKKRFFVVFLMSCRSSKLGPMSCCKHLTFHCKMSGCNLVHRLHSRWRPSRAVWDMLQNVLVLHRYTGFFFLVCVGYSLQTTIYSSWIHTWALDNKAALLTVACQDGSSLHRWLEHTHQVPVAWCVKGVWINGVFFRVFQGAAGNSHELVAYMGVQSHGFGGTQVHVIAYGLLDPSRTSISQQVGTLWGQGPRCLDGRFLQIFPGRLHLHLKKSQSKPSSISGLEEGGELRRGQSFVEVWSLSC